jgi:hypothetical protein
MFLIGFPLLVLPFTIYNMIVFLTPGVNWTDKATTFRMMSGQEWTLTAGDILVAFAILLLIVEILKATRIGFRTIIDHILSMILFIAMLIEFLMVKQAATSTFFLLLIVSMVDVMGGFIVTIRTAQRDLTIERIGEVQS